MPILRIAGILCLATAAGCAGLTEAPPEAMAQPGTPALDPSMAAPQQEATVAAPPPPQVVIQETVTPAPPAAEPPQPQIAGNAVIASDPPAAPPAPPLKNQDARKIAAPPAKAPAKLAAIAPAVEPPRKHEGATPAVKPPEKPLDVASLKARLRDTDAIGVFTKLALRNQVDDLLKQFRAHHLNGQKTSVAALRQPYDMLVLKVLALIQDSDPSLARTISGSREAIWGMLADPAKFNSVS